MSLAVPIGRPGQVDGDGPNPEAGRSLTGKPNTADALPAFKNAIVVLGYRTQLEQIGAGHLENAPKIAGDAASKGSKSGAADGALRGLKPTTPCRPLRLVFLAADPIQRQCARMVRLPAPADPLID
jgi:hypothetical protein